jgi:hypothetical protein
MNDDELRRRVRHAAELHGVSTREVAAEIEHDPDLDDGTREDDEALDQYEAADTEAGVPKSRGWGRRVAWLISLVVVGGMVGAAIVFMMKFLNGPVEAQAKVLAHEQTASIATPAPPATNELSALNILMTYPGEFDQVSRVKTDQQSLEQYNLGSKSNFRHMIAVDVRPLNGVMSDDASYRIRQIHPEDYKQSVDVIGGEPVALMTKTNGQEVTLFWAHGGKYLLTVSLTTSDTRDNLQNWMKIIKTSLRWRT